MEINAFFLNLNFAARVVTSSLNSLAILSSEGKNINIDARSTVQLIDFISNVSLVIFLIQLARTVRT